MSNVVQLAAPDQVDEAWEEYARFTSQVAENPKRLLDRGFMQEMTKAQHRFQRLYMLSLREPGR